MFIRPAFDCGVFQDDFIDDLYATLYGPQNLNWLGNGKATDLLNPPPFLHKFDLTMDFLGSFFVTEADDDVVQQFW